MAQKNINIGSSANKGDGDPIRTAFSKTQDNFTDLYSRLIVVESANAPENKAVLPARAVVALVPNCNPSVMRKFYNF